MSIIAYTYFGETTATITGENITTLSGNTYIGILDAATGQPVNGNGVTVTYHLINNGVAGPSQTVNIIGQSYKINAGTIRVINTATDEILVDNDAQIDSYPAGVPDTPPPNPNVCDLLINNIVQDKKESSPGAADGQVTITAGSTHGPIQYSLNNTDFQTSPTFTGLTSGAHTIYVKDAANCTQTGVFNIELVRNLLLSGPEVARAGNTSRWGAAFNPVFFTYQRKDFEVSGISADGNNQPVVAVNGDMTGLQLGDLVYISAGGMAGAYPVKLIAGSSITLDTTFVANATGYININRLRPYYQVLTEITYLDKLTNTFKTITAKNSPNVAGLIKADISSFLQSLLRVVDESNYTAVNFRDDNLSASYTVRFAETWDGNTPVWFALPLPYYVVYAAKQLGDNGGGNLVDYVPFRTNSAAKWVTDFAEPAYTYGYPFDLGFIYGEDLAGQQLYYKAIPLDINRQPLGVVPISLSLLNENGSFLLLQDASKLLIAKQNLINVPVAEHIGLNRLLINTQFDDAAWYFKIALFYDQDGTPVQVTQYQTVRLDKSGDDNSVYLRWVGLSGSWNYYRFIYNQEVSLDVQNATIIKNYVTDWANQNAIEDVISKVAGQKIKVMAEDLSVADIKGLQSIKYSPKVQMLVSKNPVKWQTVVVNTATFAEYDTRNGQAPFSVTFNLPSINVQFQ